MLILYGDDMIIHGAEHLDGLFDRSDIRGTDKYHRKGGNLSEICCGAKAAKLSAIGITFDSNRQGVQVGGFSGVDFLGKKDQTGTDTG